MENEDQKERKLQEMDEAVAGRVKVEAWQQVVMDVAFADLFQLVVDVKHWNMVLNLMECKMKCKMYDKIADSPQIHGIDS